MMRGLGTAILGFGLVIFALGGGCSEPSEESTLAKIESTSEPEAALQAPHHAGHVSPVSDVGERTGPGCCPLYADLDAPYCVVEIGDLLLILDGYAEPVACTTTTPSGITPGALVYGGGCPVNCTVSSDCPAGGTCVNGYCCDLTDISEVIAGLDAYSGISNCPAPPCDLGACCEYIHPHCELTTQQSCVGRGATWSGPGTTCAGDCDGNELSDICEFDCNGNTVPDNCEIAMTPGSDCNNNGIPDGCEEDCNGNGILDDCDLSAGTSSDCNGNRIPDECEAATCPPNDFSCADCNLNSTIDECDIASGRSSDCNHNGRPDECDIAFCPFGDPTCADCDVDGVLDICAMCLIPGDMNGDSLVNPLDRPDFDACHSTQGCWLVGCECADMDCDGDYDPIDTVMFDAILQGQAQQVRAAILDFEPKHGPPGTVLTVTGIGFGFDPDDLCLVAMDMFDRTAIPFQVIEAKDTVLVAVAGPQALDDDPAPLMIARGNGNFADLPPPPGVDIPLGGWLWQYEGEPMQKCMTDEFTPEPPLSGSMAGEWMPTGGQSKDYFADVGLPIPDANGPNPGILSHTIFVPDSGTVLDVDLSVLIQHTWVSDLIIDVEHNGTIVRLFRRQCGSNDDLDVRFDDEGGPLICGTPTAGIVNPLQAGGDPLAAFDGVDKQGAWTITIFDVAASDLGVLQQWGLFITNATSRSGGGNLSLTLTKSCPAGTMLEIFCRAWDHKASPVIGVDGYIPSLNFSVNRTVSECAMDICSAIIALYATAGVTINCTTTPAGSGVTMTMSYPLPNSITWGVFSINVPSVQIEINNTPAGNDDYITWAPTIGRARIQGMTGGGPTVVVLTNDTAVPPVGGDIKFAPYAGPGWPLGWPANTTATAATVTLSLPHSGAWVPFVVAGDFANPSENDKDAIIEAHLGVATGPVCATHPLMVRVRKNGETLTVGERTRYLTAIHALNAAGGYPILVTIHALAMGQAHTTGTTQPAFLPWHRAFVLAYERQLQAIDPSVSVHYWRSEAAAPGIFSTSFLGANTPPSGAVTYVALHPLLAVPAFPALTRTGLHDHLGNPMFPPGGFTPVVSDAATLAPATYAIFRGMEVNPHGSAHMWVGGLMGSLATAAQDPLFFMHHSNVDRLWAMWQFMGHHGNALPQYDAQGAFACVAAPPFRLGAHLTDTMWPWNGLTGPGFCALTTLDDRPGSAPGGTLTPPASPGLTAVLGPPAIPTPKDVIDYLGRTTPTLGLGFCYDNVPYN